MARPAGGSIMRMASWLGLAAAVATLVGSSAALAQGRLEAPNVRVALASRVALTLEIQAGTSGAPAGFVVEWMKKSDYDRLGGWPEATGPELASGVFTGVPTLNPSTGSYVLTAGDIVHAAPGDLFGETGVAATSREELACGIEYVIRAQAIGAEGLAGSEFSPSVVATTLSTPTTNCTYTIGSWKTHPKAWPVSSLTLGTVTYTQAQLLEILNTPAGGNGLLILAHQLIAAELSIANGADPAPVATTIADAHALIGGLVVPPVGTGFLEPMDVNALKDMLNSYNNGLLGVPHCGSVAARPATWGQLKARYR